VARSAHAFPSSVQYQDTLHQVTSYFTAHGSSLIQAQKQAIQWIGQQVQAQSSFLAYMDTFWVLTLISLVAIAIALALRKSRWGAPSPWAIEADRFGMLVRWESMP
jgi:MFS transporter, DHA2 family, multidrug resistance protein